MSTVKMTCSICGRNRIMWRGNVCRLCSSKLPTIKLVDEGLSVPIKEEIARRIDRYARRAALRQNLFK